MNCKELEKKYANEPRDEMTEERHIEFVNDYFEAYESEGFAKTFWSPHSADPAVSSYIGQKFEVLGRCGTEDADLECLPMWKIKLQNGIVLTAYPEEIIPSEMARNGYVPDSDPNAEHEEDETSEMIREIRELDKKTEEIFECAFRDSYTILMDIIKEGAFPDFGSYMLSHEIFQIWENTTDRESFEKLFLTLTNCEFVDYLKRCMEEITRVE